MNGARIERDKNMAYRSLKLGVWFSIGFSALACGLAFSPAVADTGCPAYIWIDCGKQVREKDGSLTQRYHVRDNGDVWPDCSHIPGFQAFYRLLDRSSPKKYPYRFDRSFPDADYYRAPITCEGGELYLDINSRTNVRIELYIYGTCGRKKLLAQIAHPLFGKAPSDETQPQGLVARRFAKRRQPS